MTYLRRLPRFDYLAPGTVAEACGLLAAHADEARVLAGGTDLLLQMRRREVTPRLIIGLKSVAALAFIRQQADGGVAIGAMTTMQALLCSPLLRHYGVLREAAAGIGGPELRHVATIGGNLAGALPCADLPPALIALGAQVKLTCRVGQRILPLEEFFPEFARTAAAATELLSEILLPPAPARSAGAYLKFHDRHAMDMTTIGVSAVVTRDDSRRNMAEVRIALASSAPVPLRAKKTEAALRGRAFGEDALEEAARAACAEADPRGSWRASQDFRLELIHSLTKRAVRSAWQRSAEACS